MDLLRGELWMRTSGNLRGCTCIAYSQRTVKKPPDDRAKAGRYERGLTLTSSKTQDRILGIRNTGRAGTHS